MSSAQHRALGIEKPGSHVISTYELSTQKLGPTDVQVRPLYIGLNPIDAKRLFLGINIPPDQYPFTLGGDAYGEVVDAGEQSGLKKGDKVSIYGGPRPPVPAGSGPNAFGTMQDAIVVPSFRCVPNPPLEPEQAPVLGPAYCTAFSGVVALMKLLELSPDGTELKRTHDANTPILVFGGSSSVGAFAIQFLALAGYSEVTSTASPSNHAYVQELGAKHVFDYSSPDLLSSLRKAAGRDMLPVVFDAVSTKSSSKAISQLVDKSSIIGLTVASELPKLEIDVPFSPVFATTYLQTPELRDALLPKLTPALIAKGLRPGRTEVTEGGSLEERLTRGIKQLHDGQVSGRKLVVKWE